MRSLLMTRKARNFSLNCSLEREGGRSLVTVVQQEESVERREKREMR